jgi:PAS domain S-box-containing protein
MEHDSRQTGAPRWEEAQRARGERLLALFDNSIVGILETTPDGGILAANAEACRLLRRSEEELRRVGRAGVVDPSDPRLAAALGERSRTGSFEGEISLRRGDGTTFPAEVSTAVYRDADGRELTSMMLRDLSRRVQRRARRGAIVAAARRLSGGADRLVILRTLLAEAMELFGARQAGVFTLDEAEGILVPVCTTLPPGAPAPRVRAGEGAIGEAMRLRRPVALHGYQAVPNRIPAAAATGVQSVLAAPLLHDDRLIGAISIGAVDAVDFAPEDGEDLEVLAGFAAAALVGLARARLAGVLLAARTAAHELNNALQRVAGATELLQTDARVPPDLRPLVEEIIAGVEHAADRLARLQRLTAVEEVDWGPDVGTTIRL